MKRSVMIVLGIVFLMIGGLIGRLTVMSLRGESIFVLPDISLGGIFSTSPVVKNSDNVMLAYDQQTLIQMWSGVAGGSTGLHTQIRRALISEMIQHGYHDFVRTPWERGGGKIVLNTAGTGYTMTAVITGQDSLDRLIVQQLSRYTPLTRRQEHILELPGGIVFDTQDVMGLTGVMLFRSREDLDALGYEVISWRRRKSFDNSVRRYNIQKSFENLGGVRVLNTSGVLSFFGAIQYDPQVQKQFKHGKGILGAEIVDMYAGGICGASTALLQGTLMNSGIVYNQLRNHTKRYTNLYRATINGDVISTPGLDATVFDGQIDFKMSNRSDYPIIIVANFGGKPGDVEEVFTLGRPENKGILKFVGRKGNCLTRSRHGETIRSCYREIDPVHEDKPAASSGAIVPGVDVVPPSDPEVSYQGL